MGGAVNGTMPVIRSHRYLLQSPPYCCRYVCCGIMQLSASQRDAWKCVSDRIRMKFILDYCSQNPRSSCVAVHFSVNSLVDTGDTPNRRKTSGQSNVTQDRIAAADGWLNHIR